MEIMAWLHLSSWCSAGFPGAAQCIDWITSQDRAEIFSLCLSFLQNLYSSSAFSLFDGKLFTSWYHKYLPVVPVILDSETENVSVLLLLY